MVSGTKKLATLVKSIEILCLRKLCETKQLVKSLLISTQDRVIYFF
jgi:hypothetical protein